MKRLDVSGHERSLSTLRSYLDPDGHFRGHDWQVHRANAELVLAIVDHLTAETTPGRDFTVPSGPRHLDFGEE